LDGTRRQGVWEWVMARTPADWFDLHSFKTPTPVPAARRGKCRSHVSTGRNGPGRLTRVGAPDFAAVPTSSKFGGKWTRDPQNNITPT